MKFNELKEYALNCKKFNKPMELLVDMPGFPAPEMITNPPENIDGKLEYYKKTYDENCEHKHAPGIRIVGIAASLHEGEAILPFHTLADGHVRYSNTEYVGEVSNDITIEGAVDDVLKVISTTALTVIPFSE